MSVITAILEPHADGSVHVPVPPELLGGKVRIEARMEAAPAGPARPVFGCLAGKIALAPDFDTPLSDFKDYME